MSREATHKAVLALASHTGWLLSEIDDMDADELLEWVGYLPRSK